MQSDVEPPPAPLETAAEHLNKAQVYFQKKEFLLAIEELKRAHALDPQPLYLFNIAQAYRRAAIPKDALAYYERFLVDDPKTPLRPETEGYCNDMRTLIAEQERAEQVKRALSDEQRRAEERQRALAEERARGEQTQKALLLERAKAERERKKPVYKRAWFWAVLGGAAVAVGAGVGLGVAFAPHDRPTDGGFVDINFALQRALSR